MEKAFALPLVNSTYDSLANLSTPLQPYAEKGAAMMSSMGESYGAIKAGVQDKVPDAVSAKVTDAKGQVSAAVNSVDSSLCSGLDKLVDKVHNWKPFGHFSCTYIIVAFLRCPP